MRRSLVAIVAVLAAALVVGCRPAPPEDPFGAQGPEGVEPTAGDPAQSPDVDVTVRVIDPARFEPREATAQAGQVTIRLENNAGDEHTLTIEGYEEQLALRAAPGEADQGTVALPPGEYTYYCHLSGHRQAGEDGVLVVEEE
ncbi:MAG: cupredoxin domain-containing protein [Actinomycetota bacterium]|nr:cupredoxin domain-containing protein [Actinomycetota bacterium]